MRCSKASSFHSPRAQGFHMPVINLPVFHGPHGMPVGVSLVAPRYRDQHLLKISQILGRVLAEKASKEKA